MMYNIFLEISEGNIVQDLPESGGIVGVGVGFGRWGEGAQCVHM
jgi:hypothetical protein